MDLKLEQEAEEYAWKKKNPFSKEILVNELVLSSKTDFIAGVSSKYVQIEKIKAQIEVLKELEPSDYDCEYSNLREYRNKIRKKKYKNFNKS